MRPSPTSTKREIASFVIITEELDLPLDHSSKDIGTIAAQPPDSPLGTIYGILTVNYYFQSVGPFIEMWLPSWPTAGEIPRAIFIKTYT